MDIRATLQELDGILASGEYDAALARLDELLAPSDLPVNFRILFLDRRIKTLAATGRADEALEACREELPLMERLFGPDHVHVAGVLHNLSMYLGMVERHEEAIPVSERELAIVRASLPGTSREADALVALAEHVYELSRFSEADDLLNQALAVYERNEGRRCLGVSTCLNNLGRSAENQGRNEQGVKFLEEAASVREEVLGVHPDTAFTLLNYGTGLAALGDFMKAADVLARCLGMYKALEMESVPYAQAAERNLKLCSEALQPAEGCHGPACCCGANRVF